MENAKLIDTEVITEGPKRFVREKLRMPDDVEIDWYYIDTPGSVMIVPITASGDVVLIRQYRHNLKKHTLELPAGTVMKGESPKDAALRELREETGFELEAHSALIALGDYFVMPSETNRNAHLFLAPSVVMGTEKPSGDTQIEKYFDMSVCSLPLAEAVAAIGQEIHGIETAAALLLAGTALNADPS
ncbi:NUDIX hydrolase [Streptomyces sp. NPDC001185]|uniref:NUDIX hydrolase n=1 Tax=Streptomyces sp. NPDC001185 TaxID=3154380 RepID=UPI00331D7D37